MADRFVMSVRQAAELDYAFERNGWTPADVKQLSGGDILANLLPLVKAYGKTVDVAMVEHIIDCDADPFMPSGLSVESHAKNGQFVLDPTKIKLYLSQSQQDGKYINGNKLHKELANEPVLNANVLDYLLKNPKIIPDEWKKDESGDTRYIFFWGTVYRAANGYLYVRYLYFDGGGWCSGCGWLDGGWRGLSPAALLAS